MCNSSSFSLFGKGIWKRFSFLFALVAGDATAYLTGSMDFFRCQNKPGLVSPSSSLRSTPF